MSTSDGPIDEFRRVTAAAVRAIARQPEATVTLGADEAQLHGTEVRLPLPSRDLPADEKLNEFLETFKKARIQQEGEEIAEAGDKANAPKLKQTAAGSSTDQGTPSDTDLSSMSLEDVIDEHKKQVTLPSR